MANLSKATFGSLYIMSPCCISARPAGPINPELEKKLKPVKTAEVCLAPGTFQEQEEINARYLDSLTVDRLLHSFRITAGIAGPAREHACPKIIGAARMYEVTGDRRYRDIAEYFLGEVLAAHNYVIGNTNLDEHWTAPPDQLKGTLAWTNAECCVAYNPMKLQRHVFSWTADARWMDAYERALFNCRLETQNAQTSSSISSRSPPEYRRMAQSSTTLLETAVSLNSIGKMWLHVLDSGTPSYRSWFCAVDGACITREITSAGDPAVYELSASYLDGYYKNTGKEFPGRSAMERVSR